MASNKTLAAIAVIVVVVIVAAAAVVVVSSDEKTIGVTYDGNGGVDADGRTSAVYSNDTAIQNIFTNNGCKFTGWNTAADGSGTSYSVGDAVTNGMTLYAQWSAVLSPGGGSDSTGYLSSIVFTIGNTSFSTYSVTNIEISTSSTNFVYIYLSGAEEWSVSNDNTYYTFTYNGSTYKLTLTVTASSGEVTNSAAMIVNETPVYGFESTGNVTFYASLSQV